MSDPSKAKKSFAEMASCNGSKALPEAASSALLPRSLDLPPPTLSRVTWRAIALRFSKLGGGGWSQILS